MKKMQPIRHYFQKITEEIKSLPDCKCDAVILCVPTVLNDEDDTQIEPDSNGSFKTDHFVQWGYENLCVNELYVSETSELIPVSNLNQISFKGFNPLAGQIIAYTCYKSEEQ